MYGFVVTPDSANRDEIRKMGIPVPCLSSVKKSKLPDMKEPVRVWYLVHVTVSYIICLAC